MSEYQERTQWIGITQCCAKDERVSSLAWSEDTPHALRVTGNLPHGYLFMPTTRKDAERLRDYAEAAIEAFLTQETARS